jgi:NAD(P)-dependent dehydrogenase (short-subunit alcohol dehydrogenase family)
MEVLVSKNDERRATTSRPLQGRGAAPGRAGSGAVVLVSSIAGLRGRVGVAHDTAAKHGVVGLMRSLAQELAPQHIRVTSVHPTNVDTPMMQNAAVRSTFRPDLDRAPTRTEFAEANLFLASEEARYITRGGAPRRRGFDSAPGGVLKIAARQDGPRVRWEI